MGAWASLIKLTLRMTHGAEAAASQRWDATTSTFSSSVPRLLSPVSLEKRRGCKWVMSAYNAQLLHSSSLVSPLLSPQSPTTHSFSSQAFHKSLIHRVLSFARAHEFDKTHKTYQLKKANTSACINFFQNISHFE